MDLYNVEVIRNGFFSRVMLWDYANAKYAYFMADMTYKDACASSELLSKMFDMNIGVEAIDSAKGKDCVDLIALDSGKIVGTLNYKNKLNDLKNNVNNIINTLQELKCCSME